MKFDKVTYRKEILKHDPNQPLRFRTKFFFLLYANNENALPVSRLSLTKQRTSAKVDFICVFFCTFYFLKSVRSWRSREFILRGPPNRPKFVSGKPFAITWGDSQFLACFENITKFGVNIDDFLKYKCYLVYSIFLFIYKCQMMKFSSVSF